MNPDLEKLRRFALAVGLILITYSIAAVELATGETIHPLGLPLKINRPEYLGIGLAIASFWGMARYFYYALLGTRLALRKRFRSGPGGNGDAEPEYTDQPEGKLGWAILSFELVDVTAPVWLNLIALGLWLYRIVGRGL